MLTGATVVSPPPRYRAHLTGAPTGELDGWFTLEAEGADAAAYADYYNNYKPSDRRRTLQGTVEGWSVAELGPASRGPSCELRREGVGARCHEHPPRLRSRGAAQ